MISPIARWSLRKMRNRESGNEFEVRSGKESELRIPAAREKQLTRSLLLLLFPRSRNCTLRRTISTLWGSITGSGLDGLAGWDHRGVIFSVVYLAVRSLLSCLIVLTQRGASKDAELLVLRHENAVLRRQIGRVHYQPGDRLWLAALSRLIPCRRWGEAFAVTPATLLAWHRRLVARKWDYTSRRRPGRPSTAAAIRKLVIRMATDNPTLGHRRCKANSSSSPTRSLPPRCGRSCMIPGSMHRALVLRVLGDAPQRIRVLVVRYPVEVSFPSPPPTHAADRRSDPPPRAALSLHPGEWERECHATTSTEWMMVAAAG